MKTYADRRNHAATRLIKVEDRVLVKQDTINKLSTYFNNKPYTVIAVKGTMITAKRNTHQITRNSSGMKTIPADSHHGYIPSSNEEEEEESDVPITTAKSTPAVTTSQHRSHYSPPRHYPSRQHRMSSKFNDSIMT